MPPRRRYMARAQRGWTEEQIDQLRHGHDFFDEAFGHCNEPPDSGRGRPVFDEALAKQAWDELGAQITAEHIAEKPGSRPWGWWHWEAPEPRRVVAGEAHPDDGFYPWSDRSGPRQYFRGIPAAIHSKTAYETETDYLDRLNLLTPDERHAIAVANITNEENEGCPQ